MYSAFIRQFHATFEQARLVKKNSNFDDLLKTYFVFKLQGDLTWLRYAAAMDNFIDETV